MNKFIVLLSLGIILLVAISTAQTSSELVVYDPNTDFGTLVVKLYPGWNMISLTGMYTGSEGEFNTCGDNFGAKAAFIWSPVEGKYLGGTVEQVNSPDGETKRVLDRDKDNLYYYAQEYGGALVIYRDGPACSYTTHLGKYSKDVYSSVEKELSESLQKLKIKKGWNFIILHPWMQDRSIADFLGTCELTKAFLFNPINQKWDGGSATKESIEASSISKETVGLIYAMKFANDCNFALKEEEILGPPPLPED